MIWPCHEYCLDVNKRFPRCAQVIWHVASRDMLALAGHSSTRCGHHKRALAILICCSEGLNQVHVFGSNRLGSSKKLLSSQNLQNLPHQLQSFVESFQATNHRNTGLHTNWYRNVIELIRIKGGWNEMRHWNVEGNSPPTKMEAKRTWLERKVKTKEKRKGNRK